MKEIILTRKQRRQIREEFDDPTNSTISSWMRFRTNSKLAKLARKRALKLGGRLVEVNDITPEPDDIDREN
ncbi:MAG: hypothetical protein PHS54_07365 [Clostridia bacterium]|nr:hypothetical protein [Clostridia bacterium]